MPIDFNPHIQFNSNINTPHRIIQQSVAFTGQLEKDTFTKSVKVDSSNVDNKYEGLKIEKKSFGTIKKTGEEATLYTKDDLIPQILICAYFTYVKKLIKEM